MNHKFESVTLPCITGAAGFLGFFLEVWLLYFGVDAKGLIAPDHPASLLLWPLTLGTVAALFFLTRKISPKVHSYVRTFPASVWGAVSTVAAAAGILYLTLPELLSPADLLARISDILGMLAAASLLFTGWARLKGFRLNALFHILVCLFFALWTMCRYRLWSGDPQMADYCFPLLANIGLMLTFYHRAAFDLRMGNRRSYQFFRLSTLFFCAAAIPAGGLCYAAFVFWLAANPAHSDTPAEKTDSQQT